MVVSVLPPLTLCKEHASSQQLLAVLTARLQQQVTVLTARLQAKSQVTFPFPPVCNGGDLLDVRSTLECTMKKVYYEVRVTMLADVKPIPHAIRVREGNDRLDKTEP